MISDTYLLLPYQLWTHSHHSDKYDLLFELCHIGPRMETSHAFYHIDYGLSHFHRSNNYFDLDRLRPSPIAASILLRVAVAIAFAFSAPSSKY